MNTDERKALQGPPETKLLAPAPRGPGISRRRIWMFAAGAALLALVLIVVFAVLPRIRRDKALKAAARREADALPVVNAAEVKAAPNVTALLLPGTVTPFDEAYLYARATGYVRRRLADMGDRVRQGQFLLRSKLPTWTPRSPRPKPRWHQLLLGLTGRIELAVATPMAMIEPMSEGTLIVVPVRNSIQRMPASAPGMAIRMTNGSIQDWKLTTIRR
jgi:hypothetical protein